MAKVQGDLNTPSGTRDPADGFDKAVKHAKVLTKTNDSPGREAKADEKAPSFFDLKSVDAPKNGTVRYTTRDGETVVVHRDKNPELYKQAVTAHFTLKAQADGKTVSLDNTDTLRYAEHITEIDTSQADKGVITYKFGANEWVINSTLTPDTFKRLLNAKEALAYKEDGYKMLADGQTLPVSSTEYKSIKHVDNGLILVETKDGKRYVVSEQLNPEVAKLLGYQSDVQKLIEKGKADGYELVESLPQDFDVEKIKVESIDKETGVIQFQYDGKKYLLPPGDASEAEIAPPPGIRIGMAGANDKSPSLELRGTRLYELLTALKETEGTMAGQALVNAIKNNDALAKDSSAPVTLDKIDNIHAYSEGGVQIVTLKDGSKITVIEALAPKSFAAYAEAGKTLEGIKRAEGDGFRLAGSDEYLPSTDDISGIGGVGEYGPGLISFTYQKPGGQQEKIIVSKDLNPEMFSQVAGHRSEIAGQLTDVDALRAKHGLPPLSELNINDLPTTEKDEDGNPLSIQDLMLRDMINEYREGVANGSIGADDPRAKFLRAIEAKSMAENGMQIIPEHGRGYKADASDPISVTGRDVREEIFDVGAIDKTLVELTNDKTIAADMERFDKAARAKVEGGEAKITETEEKIKSTANSDGFRQYIKELQEGGHKEIAEQEIQQTYLALAQIDPQLAEQFIGDLSRDTMIMDLDAIIGDPSKISPENSGLAAIDTTNYWLRAARAIPDIPSHLISSWETTVQKFALNKADAAKFAEIYQELGDTYFKQGSLTDEQIRAVFDSEKGAFQSLSATEKENLTKMFTTMKDTGTLGSMSGLFGLARGVYQLHGNPNNLASTSEGRLAIAGDFITFASFSNGFLTAGSKTYDLMLKTGVYNNLGLSKTIPQMWGAGVVPPTVPSDSALAKHLSTQEFLGDSPTVYVPDGQGGNTKVDVKEITKPSNYSHFDGDAFTRGFLDGKGNTKYKIPTPSVGYRIAGSVSRFIGSSSDLAGAVTGIVLGAFGIRDGLKNGDELQTAAGFLGVFGGAAGVVAGVASVNGAWGIIGGGAGRIIGALGPVGFLVSAGLGFIGAILGTVKSKKLHKISMKNWDQIKQFEKDGLLADNGAQNYVWLQTYLSNYRQRDTPTGVSVFDYRRKEFTGEDKTHHDYLGDGTNEITGGYGWASGKPFTFIDDEGKEHTYISGYGYFEPEEEGLPKLQGNT